MVASRLESIHWILSRFGGRFKRLFGESARMAASAQRMDIPQCERKRRAPSSRLLLHILDAGEDDALGAFPGVAEIEFILGEEHRIAVDVVGDAGTVGGDESIQFLAVIRRNPARQLEL